MSCVDCKKNHQSKCEHFVICDPKDAVFTVNQTEKIVQIASSLDECIFKAIEGHKSNDCSSQLNKLECQIDGLISYDEKNTQDIKSLDVKVSKLNRELDCVENQVLKLNNEVDKVECQMKNMSEKTGNALLSQAKELNRVSSQVNDMKKDVDRVEKSTFKLNKEVDVHECEINILQKEVKVLACKEFKDDRIESIIECLTLMCKRGDLEKLECELDKIRKELKCIIFEDSRVVSILKRLSYLESKNFQDSRVESLISEISKLEKQVAAQEFTNTKQQKAIETLHSQNIHQSESIKCLNDQIKALNAKIDRNSIALDNKIDRLEKQEYADRRIDAGQSAQISTIQTQMCKMQAEIDRLEKVILVKPVNC